MLSLAVHFRWNWGVVIITEDHGTQFHSKLRRGIERNTIYLAFDTIITCDKILYLKMIHKSNHEIMISSAHAVIIYGDKESPVQIIYH